MTMSGSLGAPHPSTCWVQNRAQHGRGRRTEPAFHSGHPGHLEFALRPGRTQKEWEGKPCWDVVNWRLSLGLSLCCFQNGDVLTAVLARWGWGLHRSVQQATGQLMGGDTA